MYYKLDCVEDKIAAQPEAAGRRAAAYWFIDGLPEIFFGILYLVLGSAGLVWGFYLRNPRMRWWMVAAVLAFWLLFWKERKILDYFKARLTYPRTGYAMTPEERAPQVLVTLFTPPPLNSNVTSFRQRTANIFFLAGVLVPADAARWAIPAFMAVVAVQVYFWNRREAHPYSWQSVLALPLAGLLSAAVEVPPRSRMFIPMLIGGVWLLAHGIPALVRYLRTYPVPKGEGA